MSRMFRTQMSMGAVLGVVLAGCASSSQDSGVVAQPDGADDPASAVPVSAPRAAVLRVDGMT